MKKELLHVEKLQIVSLRPLTIALNRHHSVISNFRTSSHLRRLVELQNRIGFVILQTAISSPVASHPTSR